MSYLANLSYSSCLSFMSKLPMLSEKRKGLMRELGFFVAIRRTRSDLYHLWFYWFLLVLMVYWSYWSYWSYLPTSSCFSYKYNLPTLSENHYKRAGILWSHQPNQGQNWIINCLTGLTGLTGLTCLTWLTHLACFISLTYPRCLRREEPWWESLDSL